MSNAMGFSVRIFVPDGEPEGLRVIEKSNWTGQGHFFPHSLYKEVRTRDEFERTGVYILWTSGQLPPAYVGEGDILRQRLDDHYREKDFWNHGIVFTSKDESLNKAHVRYLEARLYALAKQMKRCKLQNKQEPAMPSLSDADKADVELYLADMLLCLPVVGVSFFEEPHKPEGGRGDLFLNSKGIEARGYSGTSDFVVLRGSLAVKDEVASIHISTSELRKELLDQEILEDIGPAYCLVQDYSFSSPSNACDVLLGNSSNGRMVWKDAEGRTLKEIQNAEVENSPQSVDE